MKGKRKGIILIREDGLMNLWIVVEGGLGRSGRSWFRSCE